MNDTWRTREEVECSSHSGVTAEANCRVCGKPICSDCSVQASRGVVCNDPEHRIVLDEWTTLFVTKSEFEADMIVKNLEIDGITSKRFSSRSFKLSVGESTRDFVNIYVQPEQQIRAEKVLNDVGLHGTDSLQQAYY